MIARLKELGPNSIAYQVQLTLTFRRLKLMQKIEGVSLLCIEFQRNSKSMCTSNKLVTDKSMMVWGESLTVTLTLYKDASGRYLEEEGKIILLGYAKASHQEAKTLGSVQLRLNLLAPDLTTEKVALRLADDRGTDMCIIKTAVTAKLLSQREYTAADAGQASTPNKWNPMSTFFGWSPPSGGSMGDKGDKGGDGAEGRPRNVSSPTSEAVAGGPGGGSVATSTNGSALGGGSSGRSAFSATGAYTGNSSSSSSSDGYKDESEAYPFHRGRSDSPEVFEFIDDDYLLYDGSSKLYLGPGSPSKMSKNSGAFGAAASSNPASSFQAESSETTLAQLQQDLEESRAAVARLEGEYMRLQSITEVDGHMLDRLVKVSLQTL